MNRDIFILVYAASMILSACAGAQIAETGASDASWKIGSDLAERLTDADDIIPIIVMLNEDTTLDKTNTFDLEVEDDFKVKYSYSLIPGLAGEASSAAIQKIAQSNSVSGIYFDDTTEVSAPEIDALREISPENSTLDTVIYSNDAFGNSITVNGNSVNDTSVNDTSVNDTSVNDTSVNDTSVNGTSANTSSTNVNSTEESSPGQSDQYISPARVIRADKLWEMGIDGRGVNVAVIDSGIDRNHPDLIGKVIAEKNFLADEITTDDLLGHGTMIAGIIAGSGAASDGEYKGIAPGANLISVKVIDQNGDGRVSDIIAGIEWAIHNGADVLSLSLGGINLGETNPPITMAADNAADKGIVVCVAAGNRNSTETESQLAGGSASNSQIEDRSPIQLSQIDRGSRGVYFLFVPVVLALPPGLIDSPGDGVNVITLGSTDEEGHMAGFSGSGPTRDDRIKPDVVAPGINIVSTIPTGLEGLDYVDVYYARESGTSLSTPIAAGLAALLLQENGNLTPAGVKGAMTSGAVKLNNTMGEEYEEYYQGAGLLDAFHSHQIIEELGDEVVGAVPDEWSPGRWAYLPSGEGVYVGLDTGADRPQKKVYALAPGEKDWNSRFVFFSNKERDDLSVTAQGEISDWISLQALPQSVSSNSQEVFAASISVPKDAEPGDYSGSLDVTDSGETILSIPVGVTVAELLNISQGLGENRGSLSGNQWDYYYLDMPVGANGIEAIIDWAGNSSLDLFLLSPTSEYYAGATDGPEAVSKRIAIENPPSGRWLLAIHSDDAPDPVEYTLRVEQDIFQVTPKSWDIELAAPELNSSIEFWLENTGPALENLSYIPVIENESILKLEGSVGYKEIWNTTINVTNETRKLSAELVSTGGSEESEVALVLENPDGLASEENADLGSGTLGPVEVSNPDSGRWVINVYGYEVPDSGQSFSLTIKQYSEEPWTWIAVSGPDRLESGSDGSLKASLAIPANSGSLSLHRVEGYIKISRDSSTKYIEIPVSVTLTGSELLGLSFQEVVDEDKDGKYDLLTLGFGVDPVIPGDYRLEGALTDCNKSRIDLIDQSHWINESGSEVIEVNISGNDIWMNGKCGPMAIENLILYDKRGNYLDRFEDIGINRDPRDFQPPAAYLTGFVNQTTTGSIAIGVNLSVTKEGTYQISGVIIDDEGDEIGRESIRSSLAPGNFTLSLVYSPGQFMMLEDVSHVRLVDLVLSQNGEELERRDLAWTSGEMDPGSFQRETGELRGFQDSTVSDGESFIGAVLRRENGTVVIS